MKLHEAIKEAIKTCGNDVLKSVKLANIVADYNAFQDYPATQSVLKDILKQGYGVQILSYNDENDDVRSLKIVAFKKEIVSKFGYQEDVVDYVFKCIIWGLGWDDIVPEYTQLVNHGSRQEIVDIESTLESLKEEYKRLLESLLIIPKGNYIKKSAYFSASSESKLAFVENKILILNSALGKTDNWCSKERDAFLNRYIISKNSHIKELVFKIYIPVLVVLIVLIRIISHAASLSEIEKYENQMSIGDNQYDNGLCYEAMMSYGSAMDGYKGSYKESKYKERAKTKIVDASNCFVTKVIENADSFVISGMYDKAFLLCEDASGVKYITQNDKRRINEYTNRLVDRKMEEINQGKLVLLSNIEMNSGKLNRDGKKLLMHLLTIEPNDYWLNFIKKKEQ